MTMESKSPQPSPVLTASAPPLNFVNDAGAGMKLTAHALEMLGAELPPQQLGLMRTPSTSEAGDFYMGNDVDFQVGEPPSRSTTGGMQKEDLTPHSQSQHQYQMMFYNQQGQEDVYYHQFSSTHNSPSHYQQQCPATQSPTNYQQSYQQQAPPVAEADSSVVCSSQQQQQQQHVTFVPVFYPCMIQAPSEQHSSQPAMPPGVWSSSNGQRNEWTNPDPFGHGVQNGKQGQSRTRRGRTGHGQRETAVPEAGRVRLLMKEANNRGPVRDMPNGHGEEFEAMMMDLENSENEARREVVLERIAAVFWPLALHKKGCRVLQKAIELGSPEYQQRVIENIRGQLHQGIQSPHANWVLQQIIQLVPPENYLFMLDEMEDQVIYVVRHCFGCRILQRLMEHCTSEQIEPLINKVLQDTTSLIRHQYGNFVLQHVLQYGTAAHRHHIADVVHSDMIRLAKHRLASHVVSCALVYCSKEDVERLTHVVLDDPKQLAELSHSEFGSFVVREVKRTARMLKAEQEQSQQEEAEQTV